MGQKHGVDSRGKIGEVCGCGEILTEFITGSSSSPLDDSPDDCFSDLPDDCFSDLPGDCFSIITSYTSTTPQDALVSKRFRLQFSSDSIWEKFIPSADYVSQIPQSRVFSSKKELYIALCDPFPNHNGKMSFRLDKASGKKCVMLSAKKLVISRVLNPEFWKWISVPESRFDKVPELLNIRAFEIRSSLNTRIISPGTYYSAYIVYRKTYHCHGFQNSAILAKVGFKGHEMQKTLVYFGLKKRKDGWMEAKIGDFFNEGGLMGFDDLIEVSIVDVTRHPILKSGLIIEGIEFRPTNSR